MDGFYEFYISERGKFVFTWALASAVLLLFWIIHVLPFSYASVVSRGTVVAHHCGSKGFSYTYSYEVDGQAYTGDTQWGGWDGNGACQSLMPGVVVPITYRADDPARSIAGTVQSWGKMLVILLIGIAVLCFVVVPVPLYIKELRSNN